MTITSEKRADPVQMVEVQSRSVACDGGTGALGHPKVYLEIAPGNTEIVCPYCSCRFIYKAAS